MNRLGVVLALALAACGGDKAGGHDTFDDVLATWLPADGRQAWQGAWVMRLPRDDRDDTGTLHAVAIDGARAKLFDGAAEVAASFTIDRPCEASLTWRGRTVRLQFAYADGRLVVGRGAAGVRRGKRAVVCGVGRDPGAPEEGVYTLDGNRCTTWKPPGWTSRDGVCTQVHERDLDLIDVGTEHYSTSLVATGELVQSRAFETSINRGDVRRAASFTDAKDLVRAAAEAADPVARATAAGGTVGDRASIAGVGATFAANRNDVAGELALPGMFVETSTMTVHGRVWHLVVLADPAHPRATVQCQTADDPAGLSPGAKLAVRGKIDPTIDVPRLRPCRLVR